MKKTECHGGSDECQKAVARLYEFLNSHDITVDQEAELRRHLDLCRGCFDRFEFERLLIVRFKTAGVCKCPESLRKKIEALVESF